MADGAHHSAPAPDAAAASPHLLLQLWLSPSFPVGAYAYSHGLEKAAENGWITNGEQLQVWLADLVELGSLGNDMILLAHAWRGVRSGAVDDIRSLAELGCALQPSAERHLETTQQGASFLATIRASWPTPRLSAFAEATSSASLPYPVAVGVAAGAHDVPLRDTLPAFGIAFIGGLVSAAIRLGIIGQTDAQRLLAALTPPISELACRSETATLDYIGSCVWRSDLASLQHETQYTRLFRS